MAVTTTQALDFIYKYTKQNSLKILPIEQALSYILAEDIVATHNLPPYDNSAMDGFAVKHSDAGKKVKVTHTIFAGDNSSEVLTKGKAIKIMTGAKIPDGCELIVPSEDVNIINLNKTKTNLEIALPKNLEINRHIRFCGEDIKSGDLLLRSGDKLQAHQITLLASQGISHIKVYKKPRIAIFASGSELKMHFESVEKYQLYNTNAPALKARCEELGASVDFIGTSKDSLEDLKEHLKSALDSDLIITTGGVSVGDADYTKEVFSSFGMHTYFDKVEIKPGKPTTFGRIGDTFVLNLPGNPLAASLNFELFGQSILLAQSGVTNKFLNTITAKMQSDFKLKGGRRTLLPGYFDGETFKACDKSAPGMVSPLANANSYIIISEDTSLIKSGDVVKILPVRFEFNSNERVDLLTQ
ncbi:MAG: molybdopterin molybdotransferase MoeA [Sulfurimonas sp.]|nr:molybdopterin molybdotransferase MoeA [Sulfurimonas sp.]